MTNTTTTDVAPEAMHHYIRFIDDGRPWRLGETCLTAEALLPPGGVPVTVGRIEFDFDREANKPIYRAYNVDGTELFQASHSLPELKRRFQDHSHVLVPYVQAHNEARAIDPVLAPSVTEPVPSPYTEQKRETRAAKIKSTRAKSRSNSRSRGR